MELRIILLVFALVLACIAAWRRPEPNTWPIHLGWAAFAFFMAALIFGGVKL